MATKTAAKRLAKEYLAMQQDPPPYVWAVPDEKNILNWHYLVRGPPDSPYAGGEYHGLIMFPPQYPFKPPGIKMLTPSGRFSPDKKICFSMSDFHPGTWNPAWSVATILTGLLSFMLSDEITTGSITTTHHEKVVLAARSHAWNISQKRFRDAFPEYSGAAMKDLPNMGEKERGKADKPSPDTATSAESISNSRQDSSAVPTKDGARNAKPLAVAGPNTNANERALPWTQTIGRVVWEKWRWGVFMVVAVLVARFSS